MLNIILIVFVVPLIFVVLAVYFFALAIVYQGKIAGKKSSEQAVKEIIQEHIDLLKFWK